MFISSSFKFEKPSQDPEIIPVSIRDAVFLVPTANPKASGVSEVFNTSPFVC